MFRLSSELQIIHFTVHLTTSSRCGGEASHEAVGLWPCSSSTGMTLYASNIDAKDGLLARTYPYGHLVFRASCRYCPLLIPFSSRGRIFTNCWP
ncbi:hypothetical protein K443DRAFT_682152 [Laccaria amethystina LaAM-08-1]|uniref:Uncharacterized protein n=1 Tax=Laccaria amethystina LaAM-08-1 TaxID=1095629 RepID=A0A0C9XG40_9AGAR|nr:hypothetical protein K443DRAFT_682152 [Laccaria amethystina LaAM-08-1]